MYEHIPQSNKTKAKNIVSALLIGGFAIMTVTSSAKDMPLKWLFQLAGLAVITAGIFIMTRYLFKSFLYRVSPTDTGSADLSVIELQKKSRITVCRISVSGISEIRVFSAEEKEKEKTLLAEIKAGGRKRFDYCADLNPDRFMWLMADECGESVAIKLSYDETLYGILSDAEGTNE